MKKIIEYLYVGTVDDLEVAVENSFSVLGACKDPLHRQHAKPKGADKEGYIGKALPKDEPEYLWAERPQALYCNLIDAYDMKYISDEIINKALDFIAQEINAEHNVIIVCNKAVSRSPSLALMFLMVHKYFDKTMSFEEVMAGYKEKYYPAYSPNKGFLDYTRNFWYNHR